MMKPKCNLALFPVSTPVPNFIHGTLWSFEKHKFSPIYFAFPNQITFLLRDHYVLGLLSETTTHILSHIYSKFWFVSLFSYVTFTLYKFLRPSWYKFIVADFTCKINCNVGAFPELPRKLIILYALKVKISVKCRWTDHIFWRSISLGNTRMSTSTLANISFSVP